MADWIITADREAIRAAIAHVPIRVVFRAIAEFYKGETDEVDAAKIAVEGCEQIVADLTILEERDA